MEHYFTNNQQLKSEFRNIHINIMNKDFDFISDLGVFSKDKIDYGSKLLVTSYLNENKKSVDILDMGCGYGFMGIVITSITNSNVTMCDINKRAIHLSKINGKKNNVKITCIESNVYNNISSKYDVIITNPPIRAGKNIVRNILFGAFEHLKLTGELWFVMRKNHGVKSMIKELNQKYLVEIINRSKGFYVVRCLKSVDND